MPERRLQRAARALLDGIGRHGPFSLTPVLGGGNNRAFRVTTPEGPLFLKEYFDPRRLRSEFAFGRFAWASGVRAMAEPLAQNPTAKLGLYSFLAGRPARPRDVTGASVQAALDFFFSVNAKREKARSVPNAAEACFSLAEHVACVDRRLVRLQAMTGGGAEGKAVRQFVKTELIPAWERLKARPPALPLRQRLPAGERWLSPSDFGFHNARVGKDRHSVRGRRHSGMLLAGIADRNTSNAVEFRDPSLRHAGMTSPRSEKSPRISFFDFEYAGWDDPAKMVNDFFCQPRVPVSPRFRTRFVNAVARRQADPAAFRRRAAWLAPVYEVKWCCIMLNEFLPIGRQRRRFARGRAGEASRRAAQLEQARQTLRALVARQRKP